MDSVKKCLDLYAGVGGAGEGYHRVGFDVTAIDHLPQPNNPHNFIQVKALEYLEKYGYDFDFIHASPPCQAHSVSTAQFRKQGKQYADEIKPLKALLKKIGVPYVIENVLPAPIRQDIYLVGYYFGLKLIKKRKFEFGNGVWMMQPPIPRTTKTVKAGDFCSVVGKGNLKNVNDAPFKYCQGSILNNWRYAMGISWAKTYKELANAIPPAYTEYIGSRIIKQLQST